MSAAPDTRLWRAWDAAHYLHPFTDTAALGGNARVIVRGEGAYVWDSDGNQLLDGMSGLWCVNMGYGREEIVAAAAGQMRQLPYYNSFFQCAPPPAIELAKTLADIAPPGFQHAFFTGSGSETNDAAMRMIRYYWQLRGQPNRNIIISRHNAYHGSTIAAASLGGMEAMHQQGGLPVDNVAHIRQPYWFGEGGGMSADEFGRAAAAALADKIAELGAERVAAFIGEPVQGAGGVIIPPDSYWPEVQKICDDNEVPIIADEVICGFGRLGEWFGGGRFGIRPKLISAAKGLTSGYLPMGALLAHDDIATTLIEKGGEFAHGHTYGGHPACAAAALANIRLMQKENILQTVREKTAPYFQQQWATLKEHRLAGEVRGIGMLGALEIVADKAGGARFPSERGAGVVCRDCSWERGLIMRAVRDTLIVAPPLIVSRAEIDELVAKAAAALDAAAESLS